MIQHIFVRTVLVGFAILATGTIYGCSKQCPAGFYEDYAGNCVYYDSRGSGGDPGGDPGPTGEKRVFVTSSVFSGASVGSITQADGLCQSAANAAGLGGNFRAWISDNTTNAIDRVPEGGPWYFVDQTTLVFNNRAQWRGGPIWPIWTDETGEELVDLYVSTYRVWTGTLLGGTRSYDNCGNWQQGDQWYVGTVGYLIDWEFWTAGETYQCSRPARLYCFEY